MVWDTIIYFAIFLFVVILLSGIKLAKEWEKAIVLRLGRYVGNRGPGLFYVIPFIEKARKLDTRKQVMDVAKQNILTSDSVTVAVDAVVYYKIKKSEVEKSVLNVEDWEGASTTLAQTTLRDIVGQKPLDSLLTKKQEVGDEIKKILDKKTDEWGIEVSDVEIRDVEIPEQLERAMAKEAEAIREKRARVTKAEGELQASKKLREAGQELAKAPNATLIRQLQTWQEIGAEQNSLIVVAPTEMVTSANLTGLVALGKGELKKK
jgi:regulator of protease activity HflC (stomatin/prohibitin superfamily)